MPSQSIRLQYAGLDLEIRYYFSPNEAQTCDHPGYPAEVEIEAVYPVQEGKPLNDLDLLDLLSDAVCDWLEMMILEAQAAPGDRDEFDDLPF